VPIKNTNYVMAVTDSKNCRSYRYLLQIVMNWARSLPSALLPKLRQYRDLQYGNDEGLRMTISKAVADLVKERHAFYEVLPYEVVVDEPAGALPGGTRTIKAGFDVDIYGMSPDNKMIMPGFDYTLGYVEVHRLAMETANLADGFCSIDVIPFRSRMVITDSGHTVQGMLRIRISRARGLDQPIGAHEEQALKELEKRLHELGLARR
jgi:hypothetical protein